jgi:predicted transglutaminase-like cysteine proteinase
MRRHHPASRLYALYMIAWLSFISSIITYPTVAWSGPLQLATYAGVGDATSVPFGWIDYCRRNIDVCDTKDTQPLDINLTQASLKVIEQVNRWVNRTIVPISDKEHWGAVDHWDIPADGKGDCEDYVLLKRKMLAEQGFPTQAMLITVVRDKNNDGHAVLTLKTNRGEFVLDNIVPDIKPWLDTGYRFVKRQSQVNQNIWVQVGPPASDFQVASRRR